MSSVAVGKRSLLNLPLSCDPKIHPWSRLLVYLLTFGIATIWFHSDAAWAQNCFSFTSDVFFEEFDDPIPTTPQAPDFTYNSPDLCYSLRKCHLVYLRSRLAMPGIADCRLFCAVDCGCCWARFPLRS